jgi:hypothetical protein
MCNHYYSPDHKKTRTISSLIGIFAQTSTRTGSRTTLGPNPLEQFFTFVQLPLGAARNWSADWLLRYCKHFRATLARPVPLCGLYRPIRIDRVRSAQLSHEAR